MRYLSRVTPTVTIFGLLAGSCFLLASLPSKEDIGKAVERVAMWSSSDRARPAEAKPMGPAKRQMFERMRQRLTDLEVPRERTTQWQADGNTGGTG